MILRIPQYAMLYGKRELRLQMELRWLINDLHIEGGYPGLSKLAQGNHKGPEKWREEGISVSEGYEVRKMEQLLLTLNLEGS